MKNEKNAKPKKFHLTAKENGCWEWHVYSAAHKYPRGFNGVSGVYKIHIIATPKQMFNIRKKAKINYVNYHERLLNDCLERLSEVTKQVIAAHRIRINYHPSPPK